MTSYWKSIPKWLCPYCQISIHDTATARKAHEASDKHKEKLQMWRMRERKKNYDKQIAQDALAADLALIEKEALASYRKNDMGITGDLYGREPPELKKKKKTDPETAAYYAAMPKKKEAPKPFMASVGITSSVPMQGTADYADWYFAWQQYYEAAGVGSAETIGALGHAPSEKDALKHNERMKQRVRSSGPKKDGEAYTAADFARDEAVKQQEHTRFATKAPKRETIKAVRKEQGYQDSDSEGDELESFKVDTNAGPEVTGWLTVNVKPMEEVKSQDSDSEEEEEQVRTVEMSVQRHNEIHEARTQEEKGFKNLSFDFSATPGQGAHSREPVHGKSEKMDTHEKMLRMAQTGGSSKPIIFGRSNSKLEESMIYQPVPKKPKLESGRPKNN